MPVTPLPNYFRRTPAGIQPGVEIIYELPRGEPGFRVDAERDRQRKNDRSSVYRICLFWNLE